MIQQGFLYSPGMQIVIAAIGKLNPQSPEGRLVAEYQKRLSWPLTIREYTSKNADPAKETAFLLETAKGNHLIGMDERGKHYTSRQFASHLEALQTRGEARICFAIGGADGLGDTVRNASHSLLSLGAMTWPHMLARALLAEQLYRAWSILQRHPYHRD